MGTKISGFPTATTLVGASVPILQSTINKQAPIDLFQSIFNRSPGITSGDWFLPAGITSITDRTPSILAFVTAWAFHFPISTSLSTLRMHLTLLQAGAEARAGIYSNANGRPVTLLQDLGTVNLATGSLTDKDWAVSLNVTGWVWVLIWLKNVATQATVKGPNASTAMGTAQLSTALSSATGRAWLHLESAYPGSMPATAPAVIPNAAASVPLCMLRVS